MRKYFLLSLLAFLPNAATAKDFADYLKLNDKLRATIDARYSYETIDAENKPNNAVASTLRTRLGLMFTATDNLSGLVELENTSLLGPANFAHADNNKSAFYPTVNAPSNNEINRLHFTYAAPYKTNISVGRQYILLDDKRYLESDGSSQNGNSFDSIYISNEYISNLKAQYIYIKRQIRNIGTETSGGTYDLDGTHMLNLNYAAVKDDVNTSNIIPYQYLISIKETPTASSNTRGLRLDGSHKAGSVSLGLLLDGAVQSDYDNNTNDYDFGYYRVEPRLGWNGFNLRLGYETFDGNGTTSFQIPLGSKHGFNGWADVITNPPSKGLNDKYAILTYDIPADFFPILNGVKLIAGYDNFDSDNNSIGYGDEFDLGFVKKINDHYTIGTEYSNYRAQTIGPDQQKLWVYFKINY